MLPDSKVLPVDHVQCNVLTRREGLLSAAGHDLRIRATSSRWAVDTTQGTLEAHIDVAKLRVLCATTHGRDDPHALSDADRQTIERAMLRDVLDATRFPEVRVTARVEREGERATLRGHLSLHGVTRPFEASATREGAWWTAAYSLDQREFGIRPYTAMLGALKVAPTVTVEVRLRLDA